MAGDIKAKYAPSVTLTVTALQSLASSQDGTSGWGSATQVNNVNGYQDIALGATFTTSSANRQAGQISIYVVGALNDSPLFPAVASGTLGTEGVVVFVDAEERDTMCRLLTSITVDASNSAVYAFPQTAIAALFGGVLPTHYAIYVTHNCSTTTTVGFAATGNAVYLTPSYSQYT
jgi:hypothetical protein